jgi:hypothetical protein
MHRAGAKSNLAIAPAGSGIAAGGSALSAMTPSATLSWRNTMPPSSTASSALKPLPSRFS